MSIISKTQLRSLGNSTRTFSRSINESLNFYKSESKQGKLTVFLSHKHDELEDLDSSISLLKSFVVDIYIDWMDEGMPKATSGKTAIRIKEKIKENKKFIFLATEGAISSKWCNWELGYGDSLKYMDNITILPVRNDNLTFTGTEYMQIYSSVEYLDGTDKTAYGDYIPKGYYVLEPANANGNRSFITLKEWLNR